MIRGGIETLHGSNHPDAGNPTTSEPAQACATSTGLASPSPERLIELGLSWNGIPLDVWLDPWCPTPAQIERVRLASTAVHRSVVAATQRFVQDPDVRRRFGYGALQERCILADPGYGTPVPLGRLDAYIDDAGLKFLEYNTDGAAGWHWLSAVEELSRQARGLPRAPESLAHRLLGTLLACHRQWDQRGVTTPRMAIVDWKEVATRSEQLGLARTFEASGVPCTLEDPRDLELVGGKLVGSEGPIDLVYRRLVSEEAFARAGEIPAFIDGYLQRAACYAGGFRTDPAWSKTMFALLSDSSFQRQLPESDREWVQRTVPWTVAVYGGVVLCDDLPSWELEKRMRDNPGRYIIKPSRGYAGRGICAGAVATREGWEAAVEQVFAGGNWVVQEYCQPPLLAGKPRDGFRHIHGMVFMLGGQIAAVGARCSRTPILGNTTPEVWQPVRWPGGELWRNCAGPASLESGHARTGAGTH